MQLTAPLTVLILTLGASAKYNTNHQPLKPFGEEGPIMAKLRNSKSLLQQQEEQYHPVLRASSKLSSFFKGSDKMLDVCADVMQTRKCVPEAELAEKPKSKKPPRHGLKGKKQDGAAGKKEGEDGEGEDEGGAEKEMFVNWCVKKEDCEGWKNRDKKDKNEKDKHEEGKEGRKEDGKDAKEGEDAEKHTSTFRNLDGYYWGLKNTCKNRYVAEKCKKEEEDSEAATSAEGDTMDSELSGTEAGSEEKALKGGKKRLRTEEDGDDAVSEEDPAKKSKSSSEKTALQGDEDVDSELGLGSQKGADDSDSGLVDQDAVRMKQGADDVGDEQDSSSGTRRKSSKSMTGGDSARVMD